MKLIQEILEIESTPKKLREFGLVIAVACTIFAALAWWRHAVFNVYWVSGALFFLGFGVIWPQFLKPLQKAWMTLALLMGWVMSRVILSIVFFLVVTPIGFYLKLSGVDILDRKLEKNVSSYWKLHRSQQKDYKPNAENQF